MSEGADLNLLQKTASEELEIDECDS